MSERQILLSHGTYVAANSRPHPIQQISCTGGESFFSWQNHLAILKNENVTIKNLRIEQGSLSTNSFGIYFNYSVGSELENLSITTFGVYSYGIYLKFSNDTFLTDLNISVPLEGIASIE